MWFVLIRIDIASRLLYTAYMEKKLIHARTCVYNCNYHIIWTVKYRRKVITPDVENRLKEIMYQTAENCNFTIHELEAGGQDHIHLFY